MSITEIIARLGHACGLPWARCPVDHWAGDCCDRERWHAGNHDDGKDDGYTWGKSEAPTTLAEWAAEWEREHPGEPGPVASWTDGRVAWMVDTIETSDGQVVTMRIEVGNAYVVGPPPWIGDIEMADTTDVVELGRLMHAVDGAR